MTRGEIPEVMARQAVADLGGIERFVTQDANLVIGPTICVVYHTYRIDSSFSING